jgi:hypothetical protein
VVDPRQRAHLGGRDRDVPGAVLVRPDQCVGLCAAADLAAHGAADPAGHARARRPRQRLRAGGAPSCSPSAWRSRCRRSARSSRW